jgi:hypothetical protein
MNKTPNPRNADHAAALEAYRLAQANLDRYVNHERTYHGTSQETLNRQTEFQTLVELRDTTRDAVEATRRESETPARSP